MTALIILQKNAVKGKVKTRLAASIGENEALKIYLELLQITYEEVSRVNSADKRVYFSNDLDPSYLEVQNASAHLQSGADLGERIANAFKETFEAGYKKVLIIGSDCPSITAEIITEAVQVLEEKDLVIGPAGDGGYYLLGSRHFHPQLFEAVPWSTAAVRRLTLEAAERLKLSSHVLEELNDVDTIEDLLLWKGNGNGNYTA